MYSKYNKIIGGLLLISIFIAKDATADWGVWNSWNYRKQIVINNTPNPDSLINHQLLITLPTNFPYTHANNNGSDIRFANTAGATLNYWIEHWTVNGTSSIWVKIDSIPANSLTTIYMYYGNPNATNQSNGTNTFEFFDDFTTNTIGSKWHACDGGGASISDGHANLPMQGGNALYTYGATFLRPIAIDTRVKCDLASESGDFAPFSIMWYELTDVGWSNGVQIGEWNNALGFRGIPAGEVSQSTAANTYYRMQIILDATSSTTRLFDDNFILINEVTSSDPTLQGYDNKNIGLDAYKYPSGNYGRFDDIRIRKYTSTQPIITLGTPTYVNGTITSNTTWNVFASPYIITSDVVVAQGVSLNIEPNVVVKFTTNTSLISYGSLTAVGTPDGTITFTSLKDDSVGGDTNGDGGTTTPVAGDWMSIKLSGSGANGSRIKYCLIQYANQAVYLENTNNIAIIYNMIRNNKGNNGIEGTSPQLGQIGVGIYLSSSNTNIIGTNTISNNTGGQGGANTSGGWGGSPGAEGGIGTGIYLSYSINNTVNGNILLNNCGGEGGGGSSASVYGGNGGPGGTGVGIYLYQSESNVIKGNTSSDNEGGTGGSGSGGGAIPGGGGSGGIGAGIYLLSSNNNSVTDNSISNIVGGYGGIGGLNGGYARGGAGGSGGRGVGIYLSSSNNNSIITNDISDIIGGQGREGRYYVWCGAGGSGGIGASIYLSSSGNNAVTTNDILDTVGGRGGVGSPNGSNESGIGIYCENSLPTIEDNSIGTNTYGVYLSNSSDSTPVINNNTIRCNTFPLGITARVPSLFNFTGNTIMGNIYNTAISLNGALYGKFISSANLPSPLTSYVIASNTTSVAINGNTSLTIEPGAVIKLWYQGFYVYGTLTAVGTPGGRIVFTSLRDDAYGGDTNGDGPSTGYSGDWYYLYFQYNPTITSKIDYCFIRYGGCGNNSVILCDQSAPNITNSKIINNYSGIYCYNISPTIANNEIGTHTDYGIFCNYVSTTIRNNTLNSNNIGISCSNSPNLIIGGTSTYQNNIVNNIAYGVLNNGPGTVTATYNWWGNDSGPYHPTTNPLGVGNRVSDMVNYIPWITIEIPTNIILITPTSGTVGIWVTVAGEGYGNGETIRVDFGMTSSITTTASTAGGTFSTNFIVDIQPAGVTTISACGLTSNYTATGTFTIIGKIIRISPTSGTVGTIVTASGNGYASLETIQVDFGITQTIAVGQASGRGTFSLAFTADTQAYGTTTVAVRGFSSAIRCRGTFTILPKLIRISPTSGPIGTVVTVSGDGYGSVEVVVLHFGVTATITTTQTTVSGTFSTIFTIDTQPAGTVTVTAIGLTSSITATAYFNIILDTGYCIMGYIKTPDGIPLVKHQVYLFTDRCSQITYTDINGYYEFRELAEGWCSVSPSKETKWGTWTFTPVQRNYSKLTSNQNDQNFTTDGYFISGKCERVGGIILEGVHISLIGTINKESDADAWGNYMFTNLPLGNYIITPSKSGWKFTPGSISCTITGNCITNQNFVGEHIGTGSISGYITPSTPGTRVFLYTGGFPGIYMTDSYYTFTNLPFGENYRVELYASNATFTPTYREYYPLLGSVSNDNYSVSTGGGAQGASCYLPISSIFIMVKDAEEEAIPSARITIRKIGDTPETIFDGLSNTDGVFSMVNIDDGEYEITTANQGYQSKTQKISINEVANTYDIEFILPLHLPTKSALLQNYPNPFLDMTTIPYELSKQTHVIIKIYNIAGELIKTIDRGTQDAGCYDDLVWDGRDEDNHKVSSGVYFYQLHSEGAVFTRKMLVIR